MGSTEEDKMTTTNKPVINSQTQQADDPEVIRRHGDLSFWSMTFRPLLFVRYNSSYLLFVPLHFVPLQFVLITFRPNYISSSYILSSYNSSQFHFVLLHFVPFTFYLITLRRSISIVIQK